MKAGCGFQVEERMKFYRQCKGVCKHPRVCKLAEVFIEGICRQADSLGFCRQPEAAVEIQGFST